LLGARTGVSEADRAVQIAAGVHLDDAQAGVLGVLGADAAVVGTAARDLGLALKRLLARLIEALEVQVALGVPVNDGLEWSVVGTDARQHDLAAALEQLGVQQALAARADRGGRAEH